MTSDRQNTTKTHITGKVKAVSALLFVRVYAQNDKAELNENCARPKTFGYRTKAAMTSH